MDRNDNDLPPPRRSRPEPEVRPTPYIVEPTARHTHTFILLHGLGSNGPKFGSVLLETGKTADGRTLADHFPGARFIFPTARRRRSTAFKRAMLTMWFDVPNLADRHDRSYKQQPGLAESFRYIKRIIDEERGEVKRSEGKKSTVPRQNIILGGLSNGCAMSMICAIALERGIGGFVGLSGWLPFQPQIETEVTAMGDESATDLAKAGRDYVRDVVLEWERPAVEEFDDEHPLMPVFLAHGTDDDKLPFEMGHSARDTMMKLGFDVEWHGYKGLGHWYRIPEEIDDVVKFLYDKCGLPKVDTGELAK